MPNFIGLISIVFLTSFVFYLSRVTPGFSFKKHVISQLGEFTESKYLYLFSLLFYCILRLIFFFILFSQLSLWQNYPIITSFVIAYLAFIITAFITLSGNTKIHSFSATISALFTIILIFLFGIQLLNHSLFVGISNIFLANSMLWGSWYIKRKKGLNSYFQIYYILNLVIWDSIMLIFFIQSLK